MKSLLISTLLGVFVFIIFTSGIRRHDVAEKKYLTLAKQKQFDCVGQLIRKTKVNYTEDLTSDKAEGSCVLINRQYVLSAAHCFIESDTRNDTTMLKDGRRMIVFTPVNLRVAKPDNFYVKIKGKMLAVKKITIHPYYQDNFIQKGISIACDIALLELAEPLDEVVPASVNKNFDELGSKVVGVGFGASGPADKPELLNLLSKKIAGENTVDTLMGENYDGQPQFMFADFDHPTRNDCNQFGSTTPRALEYLPAGGDSGSGLFRQKNNRWELIGILSGTGAGIDMERLNKTGYYGQINSWIRVSLFADWITKEMN